MVDRLDIKSRMHKTQETSEAVQEDGEEEATEEPENAAGSFIVKNALSFMEENYAERLKLAGVSANEYRNTMSVPQKTEP